MILSKRSGGLLIGGKLFFLRFLYPSLVLASEQCSYHHAAQTATLYCAAGPNVPPAQVSETLCAGNPEFGASALGGLTPTSLCILRPREKAKVH